ncbi:serine hydrolase [uncultured Lacinutrix sp.]|uniref:serine hydrolase domain-containing protein n=1 Tax=uncultured Lacinutrix sp. TaxID=574032 RepID=UPI002638E4B3|nr:serine hydrolase [uncultured Lacinutrix sp.]
MKIKVLFIIVISFISCASNEPITQDEEFIENESLYFPPIGSNIWETTSPESLGWDTSNLQSLIDFVEEKNSKSFIILHKGKIVTENYFNGHNENSLWYWASAGKTLTSTIVGIAQDQDLLNINDKVSDYIGTNWTSASIEKENLVTNKNLLSMNSGLDDSLGESVAMEDLQYLADADSRWAYHNVYVKLQDVITSATNMDWNDYFNLVLKDKIGLSGSWQNVNNFSIYFSNTRSMARFGLMISAKGKWETTEIVSESFLNEATNTSQNINESYGYLWWLNGKSNYHLPQSQVEFQGSLIPNAPSDMYCALGKNDQKIYIVPSKDLVIIRMGNAAGNENFALSTFDNDLWEKINLLID